MISAITKSTREVVVATDANGREQYSCPDCEQPVYPRRRANWVDHFVHKKYSECRTKLIASLETDEHKLGKQSIAAWLRGSIDNPSVDIVIEKTITTIDGRCRKIDVAVVKDGRVLHAHECQLSPVCITGGKESLQARILDYYQQKIVSTWWMGEKANTDTIREYLLSLTQRKNENYSMDLGGTKLMAYGISILSNKRIEKMIEEEKAMEESEEQKDLSCIEAPIIRGETFINSLFKYANPQTARLLIKEAIANALDQSPADATAICQIWEKIQPTLSEVANPAPSVPDGVTVKNPTFATNGNGRH